MSSSDPYKGRLRVRVCGILLQEDEILLVHMQSPANQKLIWMPPGGGLEFGERLENCLKREFREETGLEVEVQDHLFVNEFINPPIHAIELYYRVEQVGGSLKLGSDPEHGRQDQLLHEVAWIPLSSLSALPVVPEKLKNYFQDK